MEKPLHLTEVAAEITPAAEQAPVTVDDRGRRVDPGIDGVAYARLLPHGDDRGSLTEVLSPAQDFWREPIVYSYAVMIRPGRIKGWGMHRIQSDRYAVLAGRVRVVLFDGRVGSPTYERFAEYHFTEANPGLLYIPPGVWHADQNWGDTDALLLNFPTEPFNHGNPDKYSIDPHSGEIPFDWTLRDG
jgi:dTDP-4-dehydrorhamnose 3,5-epimerase